MQRRTDERGDVPDEGHAGDVGVPLVIDADRVLSRASLLISALLAFLKADPLRIANLIAWALRGRGHLERKLIEAGAAAHLVLPLEPGFAGFAARAAERGRPVHLYSHGDSPILREVAARQAAIEGLTVVEARANGHVPVSAGGINGAASLVDFATARGGAIEIARQPMPGTAGTLGEGRVSMRLPQPSLVREVAKGLRLHQCVKNLIVFVPVILGGRLTELAAVTDALLAFIALSIVASGTYLVNDVWDAADDRKHWSKRERPVASGRLSVAAALGAALPMIVLGLLLGTLVSAPTAVMLLVYLAVTMAYTLHVKTVPFVDGLVLAGLFTIRLGIGAVAADVPPSPWLFVFSMFLFSSLSYAKRHTEIAKVIERRDNKINGRGYRTIDGPMVLMVGLASGISAVMIMVLYIVEEAFRSSFYGSTVWLWGFPPLVFLFIVRIWLVSARGEMSDDPVAFAIKDRPCLALLGLLSICFAFAWLG
jgi:4-hydroxybenzoate polyprenyltransferase